MDENQERRRIVNAAGYDPSDIWNSFWKIAANNQTLFENLYKNIYCFYHEDKQCLDFSSEEQLYKISNYELFLKEVLKLIDPTIFTDEKLSKKTWKTAKSINLIKVRLLCIFNDIGKNNNGEKTMVGFLFEANDERSNDVHTGKGNNNDIIQLVIVAMYIATAVATRIKEQKVVAGISFFQDKNNKTLPNNGQQKKSYRLSIDTLPEQATIDINAKKILLTEEMFTTQEAISFPVEIYENKKLVLQKQVKVKRGDFLTIKYPSLQSYDSGKAVSKLSNQTKVEQPLQKEQHILSKWFIKLKKQTMRLPVLLSLLSVAIIIGIYLRANTITQEIQTEKFPEANMYPCLDGAWLVTPLQGNQSIGVAEIASDNEYGTKGRMVIMLHELGEQVYNFTLNRNTGELKIENYQTQIETTNKIVKLKFNLKEWKLEKYNL